MNLCFSVSGADGIDLDGQAVPAVQDEHQHRLLVENHFVV